MAKVIVALSMSLDGFIAGPNDGNELPLGAGGTPLFDWYFSGDTPSRHDERFRLSERSAQVFDDGLSSAGAIVTGRRTYDISHGWHGDGPVPGLPLFVLTHHAPAQVPQTSVPYTFVTDGIESAIKQASAAAGDKWVTLMGSQVPQQCLRAGLLDEIDIAVVPVLLGGGVRLFDHLGGAVHLEIVRVVDAPGVTHLRYRVRRPAQRLPGGLSGLGQGRG